jgi:hypothetical protein
MKLNRLIAGGFLAAALLGGCAANDKCHDEGAEAQKSEACCQDGATAEKSAACCDEGAKARMRGPPGPPPPRSNRPLTLTIAAAVPAQVRPRLFSRPPL